MQVEDDARLSLRRARATIDVAMPRPSLDRRAFVTGVTWAALSSPIARAHAAPPPSVPPVPLLVRAIRGLAVEPLGGWLTNANEVYAPHHLSFVEAAAARADLVGVPAEVVTRADRDAYAGLLVPGAVNVFVVERLMDVDEPGRTRMGVAWRCLRDLEKRYVIVAAYAKPFVLAHELGHFLGNPHSKVRNNLMSYEHDEGVRPFLDDAQGATARTAALTLFAEKKLRK